MFSLLVAMALATATETAAGAGGADLNAATEWINLIDSRRWDDSWNAAGTIFKSRMPKAKWIATIRPVREPLGVVSSRSVTNVTQATSLPGVPDGQYEVVQYETTFARKKDATETVVLSHEESGWKVDGYFIR